MTWKLNTANLWLPLITLTGFLLPISHISLAHDSAVLSEMKLITYTMKSNSRSTTWISSKVTDLLNLKGIRKVADKKPCESNEKQ